MGDVVSSEGVSRKPFFVMEYVEGVPLGAHFDARQTGQRERIEIMAQVCDAVHHAHQKGVVHRDLKPGNVLIDRSGQPKILDFGVARLVGEEHQTIGLTLNTVPGQLIGTPAYMSPEQIEGRVEQVDVRSDVYAIGVMLYQALAGRLPYDLDGKPLASVARIIVETEPAPLGTVNRACRNDVATIVGKALEKSPERRYASAADLGADLRRFLNHEPILAHPPSTAYQLRKFAQRHRLIVGSMTTVFLVLIVATIWTGRATIDAHRATDRALAMNAFLSDILASADPATGRADVRLVEVLRSAATEASTRFEAHPELESEIRFTLGRAFQHLALHEEAVTHMRRAYELSGSIRGEDDELTLEVGARYAWLLYRTRQLDDAERLVHELLDHVPADMRAGESCLAARRVLARVHRVRGDLDSARSELEATLDAASAAFGDRHPATLASISGLAGILLVGVQSNRSDDRVGDLEEAEQLFRRALAGFEEVHGDEGLETLHSAISLGDVLARLGRCDEAAPLVLGVLEIAESRFGESHDLCSRAANVLANALFRQHRFEESAAFAVRLVEAERQRRGGKDSAESLSAMSDCLPYLDAGGQLTQGEAYARVLYDRFGAMGPGSGLAVQYGAYLGRFLSRQGRTNEAGEIFDSLLAGVDEADESRARDVLRFCHGAHLTAVGEYEDAEAQLLAASKRFSMESWVGVTLAQEFVRLYEARGAVEEADAWRAKLEAVRR